LLIELYFSTKERLFRTQIESLKACYVGVMLNSDRPSSFALLGKRNLITELLLITASCPEFGHLFGPDLE
jgi:hypothetical protein